jgi:hypothetical protein
MVNTFVSGDGLPRNWMDCIESWRVQYIGVGRPRGWRLLGRNPRVAAPGALAPKTAPMDWA